MSFIRHRRRAFLLCKDTGMQKRVGMLVETGNAFLDHSEMTIQRKEDSDYCSLPSLFILCWQTLLVITKHREAAPAVAQMDNTTNRLVTFKEALPFRSEQCWNRKFSRSRHWKWSRIAGDDLSPSPEKNQEPTSQNTLDSSLTSKG